MQRDVSDHMTYPKAFALVILLIGIAGGNLVPIDGLEVIQQKQLEEMREMERLKEAEEKERRLTEIDGAKIGEDDVLTPVNSGGPLVSDCVCVCVCVCVCLGTMLGRLA